MKASNQQLAESIFIEDKFEFETGVKSSLVAALRAQRVFVEWLKTQRVVYGEHSGATGWTTYKIGMDTHQGYLVAISEIAPKICTHDRVEYIKNREEMHFDGVYADNFFKCAKCNKKLKPANGWVSDE